VAIHTALAEGDLFWEPSETFKSSSRLAEYMRWLADRRGHHFADYTELWRWSVADLEAFWTSIVDFFGVQFARPAARVLGPERGMPGAHWFEGAELNYAENVFRQASAAYPALMSQSETRLLTALAWADSRRRQAGSRRFALSWASSAGTASWRTCRISPKRSWRSWRPPASAPSGRAARLTLASTRC
jgi:hypothetical protein